MRKASYTEYPPGLVTAKVLAEEFGVTVPSVDNWRRTGVIPYVAREGFENLYDIAAVRAAFADRQAERTNTLTLRTIAQHFGFKPCQVKHILRKHGIASEGRVRGISVWSPSKWNEIKEAVNHIKVPLCDRGRHLAHAENGHPRLYVEGFEFQAFEPNEPPTGALPCP